MSQNAALSRPAVMKLIGVASLMLVACTTRTAKRTESGEGHSAKQAESGESHSAKKAETGEDHAIRARESLVGRPAPGVVLNVLDGQAVATAGLVGRKPVYLKFWATWCVPCRKQMPHLEQVHRTYGDRLGVFAVNLGFNDPIETVRAFRAEHALTVPIALDADGDLAERFHVAVTPQHVIIDRVGIVRYVGHEANAALDAAIEAVVRDGAAPAAVQPATRAGATQPADDAQALTLSDGSTFRLAEHAGKPVVLSFASTWCDWYLAKSRPAMSEACIAHTRQIELLRRTHERLAWVIVMAPTWTDAEKVDEYRKRLDVSSPIGIDERSAWFHRFRVRDVLTTIVLDGRGVEIERVTGRGDDLARALTRIP